jgi:RND family efflux transporter MFP subunit
MCEGQRGTVGHRRRAGLWPSAPLLAGLVLLLGAGCRAPEPSEAVSSAPAPQAAGSPEPVVEVATARPRRGTIRERVSVPGTLLARRESRIGAEVSGRIERVLVSDGDRVEPGAPLFQIDPEPYRMALRQAEAGLDVARAERAQIEADLARANELRRSDIVAAEQLERLRTQVSVAKARERQAAESVALARHNLAKTLVTAPFGGSVAQRLADEGTTALVQPQTIVLVLQETAELEATANVPESQLMLVRTGDEALVHVEGLREPIRTQVFAVSDSIDLETRTYRVKMLVPNPEHALKAGVFARVEILPQSSRDALLVPREAVRSEEGRTRVLVVRDGRAQAVPLQLGVVSELEAEVLSGLDADSEVIVGSAAREIAPGMSVRVTAAQVPPS